MNIFPVSFEERVHAGKRALHTLDYTLVPAHFGAAQAAKVSTPLPARGQSPIPLASPEGRGDKTMPAEDVMPVGSFRGARGLTGVGAAAMNAGGRRRSRNFYEFARL
jgi:hypothetical protein